MFNKVREYASRYFVPNSEVKQHCREFDGRNFRLFKGETEDEVYCSRLTRVPQKQYGLSHYRGYGGKDVTVTLVSEDDRMGTLSVSCEGCVFQKTWKKEIRVKQRNATW